MMAHKLDLAHGIIGSGPEYRQCSDAGASALSSF